LSKIIQLNELDRFIKDGMKIMVGGFIESGCPKNIIQYIQEKNIKDITLIANTTGFKSKPLGQLIVKKRVKKVIASHIGTNSETAKLMNNKEMEVELIPQGTLAERIRIQGAGIGGFLTPTGIGTKVEENKEKIEVDGKSYLLELPLKADVAFLKAWKADESGNLIYRYSSRNFNPIMAMAADLVIVEAEEITETGSLDANQVMTPGIFVDYIVELD